MNEVINLELAIVRLNGEIFEAEINNELQTAKWLTERRDAAKASLEAINNFNPLKG